MEIALSDIYCTVDEFELHFECKSYFALQQYRYARAIYHSETVSVVYTHCIYPASEQYCVIKYHFFDNKIHFVFHIVYWFRNIFFQSHLDCYNDDI